MAAQVVQKVSVLVVISCFMLMDSCCNATRALKVDADAVTSDYWTPAVATWYGEQADQGFGSDDGACGYGADVGDFPFSAMVSAGSPSLFLSGKGCGNCYQVRCTTNNACSGSPVSVVITDSCTDETCASNATDHFDLSGIAFEALANSGQIDELLKAGSIQIEYQKVECSYPGTPLTFKIGSDSNSSNFSVLIEYVPGDGDLASPSRPTANFCLGFMAPHAKFWGCCLGSQLRIRFEGSIFDSDHQSGIQHSSSRKCHSCRMEDRSGLQGQVQRQLLT
ncbi:unnamed protein product [Rhodiola kirilowii]